MNCLSCGESLSGNRKKFCSRKCKSHYYNKQKTQQRYKESLKAIQEDWIAIDNNYYITPNGKVWSRKYQKFLKPDIVCGYEQVKVHGKAKKVHRLVAEAFIQNPNNLPQVNHIDGDKLNNKIENLEWIDPKGNYYHARKHNLCNHGTFLDQETRKTVRELYSTGNYTYKELQNKFNISETTLWRILKGLNHSKKQKRLTFEEGKQIAETFHTGNYSKLAVAKMFDVSDTTVGRWHKKIYGTPNIKKIL